jgi:protein-S-isoprenylcysteine O-methyltransferase Ste14
MNLAYFQFVGNLDIKSGEIIGGLWAIFVLYWLFSAFKRKKTKQREDPLQRLLYVIPLVLSFYLLRDYPVWSWLYTRFVPDTVTAQWIAVALTAAGVGIAIWARWHLGSNWSGVVTLKEGHELIRTGPYRAIRHPIYTGILLAILGTAVAIGEFRGLVALGIAWTSFYFKARREESFLVQEFGPRFTEHQQHTGMFLPRFS